MHTHKQNVVNVVGPAVRTFYNQLAIPFAQLIRQNVQAFTYLTLDYKAYRVIGS